MDDVGGATARGGAGRLRALVVGEEDTRLRATWRVLLAWPVLWFLAGSAGVAVAGALVPADVAGPPRMLATGLALAAGVLVAWTAWARWLDRRPLAAYGLHLDRSWWLDLLAGFAAVLVGVAVWLGLGEALGWADVAVAGGPPGPATVAGLLAVVAAIAVNVWAQETVFVGVTVVNAAEGLASRGVDARRAVLLAWAVAVLVFAVKHRPTSAARVLNLVVALGLFAALFAHTGELALPIGVHAGVNYASSALVVAAPVRDDAVALLAVETSLSGLAGSLAEGAIPQLLVAYGLLLGWLRWRRGGVGLETDLARRRGR